MPDNIRTLYFDEAGFTGNNLSDPDQPFFAYAAIQIDHDVADAYVRDIRRRFNLRSSEFKGGPLCRRRTAHRIVTTVLEEQASHCKVVVCEKAYGLAAKLFEYLVEPIISSVSSVFYNRDFHRFVANGLYLQAKISEGGAQEFLRKFQAMMRDNLSQPNLVPGNSIVVCDELDFSLQVLTLVSCHSRKFKDELQSLQDTPLGRWCLDLSSTAIWSLLREFGTDMRPINAFADASKPLDDQKHFLDIMIGREEQATVHMFGSERPLLFNFASPLQLVDSANTPGIQLADLFATATVYAIKNPESEIGNTWSKLAPELLSDESVLPDPTHFDLNQARPKANATVLNGLIQDSLTGQLDNWRLEIGLRFSEPSI